MSRHEQSDWAICPHCRALAEQTYLLPADTRAGVRWSTCTICRQTTIWEGPVVAFPPLRARAG